MSIAEPAAAPGTGSRAKTRVVTDAAGFAGLREAWSRLLPRAEDANVFLSWEWLHSWWTSYAPAAELAIIVAEDGGEVVGIAPMMFKSVKRYGLGYRVLRFLGDGTAETDHMNFIVPRERRAEILGVLLAALDGMRWDAAHLNQLPGYSANAAEVIAWARRGGRLCEVTEAPCPIRYFKESYEGLLGTLQSRFRSSMRSSRRKLQEKYRLEFGWHQDPATLDASLATLFELHGSRWQGKGQAGVFVNPAKRAFYALMASRLLERGWLRFFHLKLDGRIVAQEFCFELFDGQVYLLQEGFDFPMAQENIGNTLRGLIFEHLIQEGKQAYDFLAGMSRHKQIWSSEIRKDLLLEIARPGLKGSLYFHLPKRIERLKTLVKKFIRPEKPAIPPAAAEESTSEKPNGPEKPEQSAKPAMPGKPAKPQSAEKPDPDNAAAPKTPRPPKPPKPPRPPRTSDAEAAPIAPPAAASPDGDQA